MLTVFFRTYIPSSSMTESRSRPSHGTNHSPSTGLYQDINVEATLCRTFYPCPPFAPPSSHPSIVTVLQSVTSESPRRLTMWTACYCLARPCYLICAVSPTAGAPSMPGRRGREPAATAPRRETDAKVRLSGCHGRRLPCNPAMPRSRPRVSLHVRHKPGQSFFIMMGYGWEQPPTAESHPRVKNPQGWRRHKRQTHMQLASSPTDVCVALDRGNRSGLGRR